MCSGPFCSISSSCTPGSLWCFPLADHFLPTCSETSNHSALYLLCLMLPEAPTQGSSKKEPFNSLDYLTILTFQRLDPFCVFPYCYNFLMKYCTSFKSLRKIKYVNMYPHTYLIKNIRTLVSNVTLKSFLKADKR